MANNNEGGLDQKCPFWQKRCAEVCPACPLYIEIMQQKMILGVMKVEKQRMCYFPASAMIMSNKPIPVQQSIPSTFGRG